MKEPEKCPCCNSKHFSYEGETRLELDTTTDIIDIEHVFACGECDERFIQYAQHRLVACLAYKVEKE